MVVLRNPSDSFVTFVYRERYTPDPESVCRSVGIVLNLRFKGRDFGASLESFKLSHPLPELTPSYEMLGSAVNVGDVADQGRFVLLCTTSSFAF